MDYLNFGVIQPLFEKQEISDFGFFLSLSKIALNKDPATLKKSSQLLTLIPQPSFLLSILDQSTLTPNGVNHNVTTRKILRDSLAPRELSHELALAHILASQSFHRSQSPKQLKKKKGERRIFNIDGQGKSSQGVDYFDF